MKVSEIEKCEILATPFVGANSILGGGVATRRILEVAGPWKVGKSTFALQFVAKMQHDGRKCYWSDVERTYDPEYAKSLGVDNEALEYDKKETAEEYLDTLEEWARKHKNGVIVVDAIGALTPREELEKGAEGRSIGVQARILGSFCRRISPIIDTKNHALILLNHTFIDPGTSRLTASGGRKLEYAKGAALWLRPAYGKPDKRDASGKITAKYIEAECKKNKQFATEGMKVVLELIPGAGFAADNVPEQPKRGRGRPKLTI